MIHGGELALPLGAVALAAAAGGLLGWGCPHWARDEAEHAEAPGCVNWLSPLDDGCGGCVLGGLLSIFADSWLTLLLLVTSWVLAFVAWPVEGLGESWSISVNLFLLIFSRALWIPLLAAAAGFTVARVAAARGGR